MPQTIEPENLFDLMAQKAVHRTFVIPVSNYSWAEMSLWAPMTENEWSVMMLVLEAMKPALVDPSLPTSLPTGTDDLNIQGHRDSEK